jgi:hypothetical protein
MTVVSMRRIDLLNHGSRWLETIYVVGWLVCEIFRDALGLKIQTPARRRKAVQTLAAEFRLMACYRGRN